MYVVQDNSTTGFESAFSKDFIVSFLPYSLPYPALLPHPLNPSCPISLLSPSYCLYYTTYIWDGISKQFNVPFSHMTNNIKYFRKENIHWLFVLLLLRTVCSVDFWLCNSYSYLVNLIINPLFPHVQLLNFLHSVALETIFLGIQNHEIFLWPCQFGELLSLL